MHWGDFKSPLSFSYTHHAAFSPHTHLHIAYLYIKNHFDHVPCGYQRECWPQGIPNGNLCVCSLCLCVCACLFMCGRAAGTGDFLCWGRERLGHFIFSCVHCQKGQRSKVRAIGEFRAACRQIRFQGWGRVTDRPRGIGACVCVWLHTCMHTYVPGLRLHQYVFMCELVRAALFLKHLLWL